MRVIHSLLKARYGDKPSGHWVVLQAQIRGVKILAIGYVWSHTSVSYFVLTWGSTCPADISYEAHYEDDFGNVTEWKIPQPHLLEWVYNYLPLIDEHNKQRQSLL